MQSSIVPQKPPAHTREASILLGKTLFSEKRLSQNHTRACASCHAPELAFTDGYRRSLGIYADAHQHNSPSLLNVAFYKNMTWADSSIHTFTAQMQQPFFGHSNKKQGILQPKSSLEMGLKYTDTTRIVTLFKQDNTYKKLFEAAKKTIAWRNIEAALSEYLHTLQTDTSRHKPISAAAIRGKAVFFAAKTQCASCHPPPYYTLAATSANAYFNIGLYQKYPNNDRGLEEITHKTRDNGKFRVPSLLNCSLTAPYMHDGSVETLSEVIAIFEHGGHGTGSSHPQKSKRVQGFWLSPNERRDLLTFLYEL